MVTADTRIRNRAIIAIRSLFFALLLGRAFASSAGAQAESVRELRSLPGSSLTIRGSTTIGGAWRCASNELFSRAAVLDGAADGTNALPDVRSVIIGVPVSGLHCQNGRMERAMRRVLRADHDTTARVIVGRFDLHDPVSSSDMGEVNLAGTLRVAGVERSVLLRSSFTRLPDGSTSVYSKVPLSLTSFGITPPRVLFGIVRARDAITVEVDLRYPASRAIHVP